MMIGIFAVLVTALFIQDNSEFIQDMNDKQEWGCTFSYTGKQYARDDVPHIAVDDTYIYFTMEPCDE
tara:strand:- start:177 stop:377 length:201 start_codon:yes stop_codon:yes gene_type:complete